jgi:transcription elongation GreA/GreB family factor
LDQARVVAPSEIPEDVVTMNCLARLLDTDTWEETECWLRFSPDARTVCRVAPILSEIGTALLGSKEGDIIEWSDQSGKRKSKILEIIFSQRDWETTNYRDASPGSSPCIVDNRGDDRKENRELVQDG